MEPELYSQPLTEYDVADITTKDGILDHIPLLNLDLPDDYIINNLRDTIEQSYNFWNQKTGYNLRTRRFETYRMLEGEQIDPTALYRYQTPYMRNELHVGADAIVSYVAANTPSSECYPAQDTPESRLLARHLEDYQHAYADKFYLPELMETWVWNALRDFGSFIKLEFKPDYGRKGEIVPRIVDSKHCIVDHLARKGENPRFFCEVLRDTAENLVAKFPDAEEEIMRKAGIAMRGHGDPQSAELAYREVWFTARDKDHEPYEAVCWYMQDTVLDKKKNFNWLDSSEGENFLDKPSKPYVPLQLGFGDKWLDQSNAIEQAIPQQKVLNKLGRQLIDNIASANGTVVIDVRAMDKGEAQNWTHDPNQALVLELPPGVNSIKDVIEQLPPQIVSPEIVAQINETVAAIHGILGTPSQFRGDDSDQTKTASEALMIKNQSSGRQDRLVRSVERGVDRFFNMLTQMMVVWYDKPHLLTIDRGDGNFDYVEMHRDQIETGIQVKVRTGTTLPFDKARQEQVAIQLGQMKAIAPYDLFRLLHVDDPQKLYDNLVKFNSNPMQLAQDIGEGDANDDAIMDFRALMGGAKPDQREDVEQQYLNQFLRLMITDAFLQAKPTLQQKVLKFYRDAKAKFDLKEQIAQIAGPETDPEGVPPAQPQAPGMMGQPGMPGMPGAPMPPGQGQPPMPGSPIQGIMQGQPMPQPAPVGVPAPTPGVGGQITPF